MVKYLFVVLPLFLNINASAQELQGYKPGNKDFRSKDYLTLPFSQYVLNLDMYDGTSNWKYSETLEHTESIIPPPKPGENNPS